MILKLSIVCVVLIAIAAISINLKPQITLPLTQTSSLPKKVALQVGHWENRELPEELKKLRENDGAEGGGKKEWEVNLKIAQLTARKLQEKGFLVEILPATIPPGYKADAFIAIHADAHADSTKNGFKASTSWYTQTPQSEELLKSITEEYLKHTDLPWEDTITNGMKGYYGFNWTKFKHSVSPETPAVIVENGFLTNPKDQKFLIEKPEVAAEGLAQGIEKFFRN